MNAKSHNVRHVIMVVNRRKDMNWNQKAHYKTIHANDQSKKICELIQSENWGKLKFNLKTYSVFGRLSIATHPYHCSPSCKGNHSILHFACQNYPPINIVKLLIKSNSKATFDIDCKGRQALHVACKYGCEPDVIKELLENNPNAAKRPDNKGRSPFLLACKSYVKKSWTRTSWKKANKNLEDVLKALHKHDPRAHALEDLKNVTPLEYAVNGELKMRIVRLIQSMAEIRQTKIEEMNKIIAENQSDPLNYTLLCMRKNYVVPKSNKASIHPCVPSRKIIIEL